MSVTRRVFPDVFKREAVDRVATSGLSVGAVARELGLHETVLRRWIVQYGTQATGTPRRPSTQAVAPSPSDLAAENARLRRENERLRMERDILKKAALIFGSASR
jgi:transposase